MTADCPSPAPATICTVRPCQALGSQSWVVSLRVVGVLLPVDLSARRIVYQEVASGTGDQSGPATVSVLALLPVIRRTWPVPGPATISTTRSRHWSGCQRWVVSFSVVAVLVPVDRLCVAYTLVSLDPLDTTNCELLSGVWLVSQVPAMVNVLLVLDTT